MFAVYAGATLLLALHHEPWRDEANTWLVARDLPLREAVAWSRLDGTPLLWYAILAPFARGGFPFLTQSILHLLIAWTSAALVLARAPFTMTLRALILFSVYFLYHYAVIARSYALGILLLFGLLAMYESRHARPIAYATLVALLSNVNAHSVGFAAALIAAFAIEMLRERRREWPALAIMIAGTATSFVQFYTPGYVVPPNVVSPAEYGSFLIAAGKAFLPAAPEWLAIPWAITLMALIAIALRRSIDALLLFLGANAGLWAIYTFLWIDGYRHYGLVLVAAIAALWAGSATVMRSRAAPAMVVMLLLSLLSSIPLTVQFAWSDFTKNYSGSLEMARFIERRGLSGANIAAHAPAQSMAVLVQLPRKTFWYPAYRRAGSHMFNDRAYRIGQSAPVDRAAAVAAAHFGHQDWLFLANGELRNPDEHGLRLLYATSEPLMSRDLVARTNDERYWLYEAR